MVAGLDASEIAAAQEIMGIVMKDAPKHGSAFLIKYAFLL